jgi:hypothetical protein
MFKSELSALATAALTSTATASEEEGAGRRLASPSALTVEPGAQRAQRRAAAARPEFT